MAELLPIQSLLPEIGSVLETGTRAVLSAPPGSGKTTLVPLALFEQPWLGGRKILMLEPRRLATRAAAARMAWLLGESVGETVGYRVRLDSRVSARTRIEVVTEGVLTRMMQRDPELADVGLVIFDEYHERSLQADLALALCLDLADGLREDLRLLVMSATLNGEAVCELLGGAILITGEGFLYPVEQYYLSRDPGPNISQTAISGVLRAVDEQEAGDLLVFLPGRREIRQVADQLERQLAQRGIRVTALYGDLTKSDQDSAILADPTGRRRVVLATSIAETSLTIEGISTVVDAGWSRLPEFDPKTGLTRLKTVRVSLASADQRSARAGRLGPGVCYRLWSNSIHSALRPYSPPEILSADLSGLVLELAQWGVSDPAALNWLDLPPPGAVAQARDLLEGLEALDRKGRISRYGRRMLRMAMHPRLAHMLLKAEELGQFKLACDLAALISERDISKHTTGRSDSTDIEQRLRLLHAWRAGDRGAVAAAGGSGDACAQVVRVSEQFARSYGRARLGTSDEFSPGMLLAYAYPDRIARRRDSGSEHYLLASGRGVRLATGDPLSRNEFVVVPVMDAGRAEGRAFMAAAIELTQLRQVHKRGITTVSRIEWEKDSRSVVVREEERLGAVLVTARMITDPDPDAVLDAMLEGIRIMGLDSLPWNSAAIDWQARVMSLRFWQPDGGWPDISHTGLLDSLKEWLGPWLGGFSRNQHLKKINLEKILRNCLTWQQQRLLEQLAPTHISVPSGSNKRLSYCPGEPPVLKVKLQEMFGMVETPRVCAGRVPVMLHLLSPAQRPVQVTQDLKGFWDRTYKEVRKELKGRYPKHYWPDNPWQAIPTARVRPPI